MKMNITTGKLWMIVELEWKGRVTLLSYLSCQYMFIIVVSKFVLEY